METKKAFLVAASLVIMAVALPAHAATVAYYDFEEGSNGVDATSVTDSGDGTNTLTPPDATAPNYTSATVPSGSPSGSTLAMEFDGVDGDELVLNSVGTSTWATGGYSDFTLEAWVYFNNQGGADALGGWQTIVGRDDVAPSPGEGVNNQSLLYFSKHTDDYFRIELIDASNSLMSVEGSAVPLSPETWYHVAAVGDSSAGELELFVNGSSVGTNTSYTGLYDPGTDTTWTVGRGQFDSNEADRFNGLVDDVRFSDVALDPAQFLYVPPAFLWTADADGNYSDTGNWFNGDVPPTGSDPTFGDAITENRNVTLDSSVSLNSVTFANAGDGDYFILDNGGGETLTLTGDAEINTSGRHQIVAAIAGTAGLNATGGGELVLDAANSFSGGLNVSGANVSVVTDGAIPAGNAITLDGAGDLRFFGADNPFFTDPERRASTGFSTGTISDAVSVGSGSIFGVFDGVDLTLSGAVTANGILSADDATLTFAGSSTTTFDINDDNVSGSIVGAGTVNLDGAFAVDTSAVTDTLGGWNLVDVGALTETFGAGFSVSDTSSGAFSESGGIWTNGAWAFNQNTGLLSTGNVWAVDADGDYGTGANWNSGIAPAAGGDVLFSNAITENRTVTLGSNVSVGDLVFDNVDDGDYFIVDNGGGETITLTNATGEINTLAGRHWIQAGLANDSAQGFTKTGGGELIFDAANTYGGDTVVSEGKLSVLNSGGIPTGSNISIASGAELLLSGGSVFFVDNGQVSTPYVGEVSGVISGDGILTIAAGADVTFSGANTYTNATTLQDDAVLTVTGAGSLGTVDGATVLNGSSTVHLDGVSIGDEAIDIHGTSQIQLSGVTVGAAPSSALIRLDESADGSAAKISSTGSTTINHNIYADTAGDGSYYEIESASGTLTLDGVLSGFDPGTPEATPSQRFFVFSGDGDHVVSKIVDAQVGADGNFVDSSSENNIQVVKRGAGTLTINTQTNLNDDYHFGTTTIEEGTLVVTDDADDGELRSDVLVKAGATFDVSSFGTYNLIPLAGLEVGIGGGGTVIANSLAAYEATTISPGDSVGTLNVTGNMSLTYFDNGAATVPDSGSLNFELGDDASVAGGSENDLVDVSGSLTVNRNAGAEANSFVVNVTPVDGAFDTTTNYRLMRGASRSGNALASNFTTNIVDSNGAAIETRYTASVVLTSTGVDLDVGGGALNLTWNTSSGTWDADDSGSSGTPNWTGGDTVFMQLDQVTFNSVGGGGNVVVTEDVSPGSMTVSNSAYNFSGNPITTSALVVNSGATANFGNNVSANAITVASNATAGFSGTVSGDVQVQSTGTLSGDGAFQNNVTAQAGGTIQVGAAGLASSTFLVVDDFNYDNSTTTNIGANANGDATGGVWAGRTDGDPNPQILTRSGSDNSLSTFGPTWVGAVTDLSTNFGSDHSLANGETATYFFEVMWDGVSDPDTMIGLAPDGTHIDAADAWQDYEVMPFVANQGGVVALRSEPAAGMDGGDGNLVTELTGGEWVNVWVVVDNDAQTYDVYTSTGTDAGVYRQTSVYVNNGDGASDLAAWGISGNTSSVVHIDNLYRADNQDTSNPLSGSALAPAFMTVEGDVTLEAGSTISFDIADSGINDQLDVLGDLSVEDGFVLELVLDGSVSAASLAGGDSWDLFDFASAAGAFDQVDFLLPALSGDLLWDTTALLTTGVISVLSPGLDGDFNGDNVVDAADYTVWRDNLGMTEDGSVLNGNGNGGIVDQTDYMLWRSNYGNSLAINPNEGLSTNVPEPAAVLLMLASLAGLTSRRRSRV